MKTKKAKSASAGEGLLCCPFCGEIPNVEPENPQRNGNAWARVICYNKKCQAKPAVYDGIDVADDRGSDAYKAEAIKRWNTRTAKNTARINMRTGEDERNQDPTVQGRTRP